MCGKNNLNTHKRISIDLDNGEYLFADATYSYPNPVSKSGHDLAYIKLGIPTSGFIISDTEYNSDIPEDEISELNKNNINMLTQIDSKIGYNNNGVYQNELYQKYGKQFENQSFLKRLFKSETREYSEKLKTLLNILKENMTGLESFIALRAYSNLIFNSKQLKKFNNIYVDAREGNLGVIYNIVRVINGNDTKYYLKRGIGDNIKEVSRIV